MPENKRKLRSSMSPPATVPPKRRSNVLDFARTTDPSTFPESHSPPPAYSASSPANGSYLDRHPRPARWRKSHAEARQPVLESIYKSPSPEHSPVQHNYGLRSQQQHRKKGVELRFSFSKAADAENSVPKSPIRRNVFQEAQEAQGHPEDADVVYQSFSNLSFEQESPHVSQSPQSVTLANLSRPPVPHVAKEIMTKAWADQLVAASRSRSTTSQLQAKSLVAPRKPTIPELSKPRREGYGFSYSESAFCDSEDYPDTECGPVTPTQQEFPTKANTTPPAPDASFEDLVVVRDVGSFHLARPQRKLPCTIATREDTIRLKTSAKTLLKFKESQEIYAALVSRLERMVHLSDNQTLETMIICAVRLRNFLVKVAEERAETGEVKVFVQHEIEWAKWLVEASHTGVMHLRGNECQCTSDWAE